METPPETRQNNDPAHFSTTLGYRTYHKPRKSFDNQPPRPEGVELTGDTRAHSAVLRILLVTARFFPLVGGTEIQTYELARRLSLAGHDVTVFTTNPGGQWASHEQGEGFMVHRWRAWPAKGDFYFAPGLYRAMLSEEWDLIHCQGVHTLVAPIALTAAWRSGIPYVVSFHSGGHSSRLRKAIRGVQWQVLRPLLARAERLIGVSLFEAEFFQRKLRLPQERFTVIPGGSNLPPFSGKPDAAVDGNTILSVGRLERYKGHHRIIAALPLLLPHFPDIRLLIIGAGPFESNLRRMARNFGVEDRVEIRAIAGENRSEMTEVLSGAQLVILLSDYESQGISVYEALAMGRPVLVANTSALTELAQRGLVSATPLGSTSAEVAAAIRRILREPPAPTAVELPTWDATFAAHLALYEDVIRSTVCVS